jgi:SET domain-containing protein
MKRILFFLILASFALQAEKANFSSQFLKLLEPEQTVNPIAEKKSEKSPSKTKQTSNKTPIKIDDQNIDPFLQLLTIHENVHPKLYKEDLENFNFKYINHLEYADGFEGFPVLEEKKLPKADKQNAKNYGKLIAQGYEAPWYLQYIDEQIGHGAFADDDIEEGQMIGEYTGIVTERYQLRDFDSSYGWSLIAPEYQRDSQRFLFVDARRAGNFTRFINHSNYPNIKAITIYSHDEWHMVYIAARLIKKGEQLLVDYGIGYWAHKTCKPIEMGLLK